MPRPLHPDERDIAVLGLLPGVVENEEVLLREMYSPHHVENGKVKPSAITLDELKGSGASVHRKRYTSRAFLETAIQDRLSRVRSGKSWTSEGVAVFTAEEVRELPRQNTQGEDEQAFVVKDTASPERPGHASIHFADLSQFIIAIGSNKLDEHLREWRLDLLDLLEKRMSVDEAFQ